MRIEEGPAGPLFKVHPSVCLGAGACRRLLLGGCSTHVCQLAPSRPCAASLAPLPAPQPPPLSVCTQVVDQQTGAVFCGESPTKPWTDVCIAHRTGQRISGPLFFGFSDPLTQRAIAANLYSAGELAAALQVGAGLQCGGGGGGGVSI